MKCSRCDEKPVHSILVRIGETPDPKDPKMKDKDKSGVYVYRFCDMHWRDLKKCLPAFS